MQTVIFFDLDGTLIINPFWSVIFPKVSQQLAPAAGKSPEAVLQDILEEHDYRLANPLPVRAQSMDWEDIFQTVAARYGTSFQGSAEEWVNEHAAPPYSGVLDDAKSVLQRLQAPHRRFVAATMGLSKYQLPVLRALGLLNYFETVLTPDRTGALKTDQEFYRPYLEQNALRIHIGDRYDHDCYYPRQFGGISILRIPKPEWRDFSPWERRQKLAKSDVYVPGRMHDMPVLPHAVIVHLGELLELINTLEQEKGTL